MFFSSAKWFFFAPNPCDISQQMPFCSQIRQNLVFSHPSDYQYDAKTNRFLQYESYAFTPWKLSLHTLKAITSHPKSYAFTPWKLSFQSVKSEEKAFVAWLSSTSFPINCRFCRYIVVPFHSILHFPMHIFLLTLWHKKCPFCSIVTNYNNYSSCFKS